MDFYLTAKIVRLLIIFSICIVFTPSSKANEKPNIIFIMSDDHTAQAVGAYATLLKSIDPTPNIDRLAREGICFDNAFCTNGICTPFALALSLGNTITTMVSST